MIVLGTLGSRVLTGAADEEAEVEEGRSEEDGAAEEEGGTAVSFHALEVEEASAEAEVLATDDDALDVTLALADADADPETDELAMLEVGSEASVRDSEKEDEEAASEADPE